MADSVDTSNLPPDVAAIINGTQPVDPNNSVAASIRAWMANQNQQPAVDMNGNPIPDSAGSPQQAPAPAPQQAPSPNSPAPSSNTPPDMSQMGSPNGMPITQPAAIQSPLFASADGSAPTTTPPDGTVPAPPNNGDPAHPPNVGTGVPLVGVDDNRNYKKQPTTTDEIIAQQAPLESGNAPNPYTLGAVDGNPDGPSGKYQISRAQFETLQNQDPILKQYTWDQFKSTPAVQDLAMHSQANFIVNTLKDNKLDVNPINSREIQHFGGAGGVALITADPSETIPDFVKRTGLTSVQKEMPWAQTVGDVIKHDNDQLHGLHPVAPAGSVAPNNTNSGQNNPDGSPNLQTKPLTDPSNDILSGIYNQQGTQHNQFLDPAQMAEALRASQNHPWTSLDWLRMAGGMGKSLNFFQGLSAGAADVAAGRQADLNQTISGMNNQVQQANVQDNNIRTNTAAQQLLLNQRNQNILNVQNAQKMGIELFTKGLAPTPQAGMQMALASLNSGANPALATQAMTAPASQPTQSGGTFTPPSISEPTGKVYQTADGKIATEMKPTYGNQVPFYRLSDGTYSSTLPSGSMNETQAATHQNQVDMMNQKDYDTAQSKAPVYQRAIDDINTLKALIPQASTGSSMMAQFERAVKNATGFSSAQQYLDNLDATSITPAMTRLGLDGFKVTRNEIQNMLEHGPTSSMNPQALNNILDNLKNKMTDETGALDAYSKQPAQSRPLFSEFRNKYIQEQQAQRKQVAATPASNGRPPIQNFGVGANN